MIFTRHRWVTAFTAVHLVALTAVGVARGMPFVWVYVPVIIGGAVAVAIIDQRAGPISELSLWLMSFWILGHMAGGLLPDPSGEGEILYNLWLIEPVFKFDQLVHAFGIGATVWMLAEVIDLRRAFWWATAIGVGNEVVENIFAALVERSNVGDALNTTLDIVYNTIGALIAVWAVRRQQLASPG